MSIKRIYSVRDFLNEDSEKVDEFFIRSMKKRPKPKYDDEDRFVPDDKDVDYDKLISFDRNRVNKISDVISAYPHRYSSNSKKKEDTIYLHFQPTIRSSFEDVKKQLSKLKNVLKIKSIRVMNSLIMVTLKNQHKYA